MPALPYMPLYVADYLADTSHLSTLENGAYLMLLMNYWQRGDALPAGELQLSRIARVTLDEWRQIAPVISEFFEESDGKWFHHRVEDELAKVRAKSEQASNAGKASARSKGNGRSTGVEQAINHTDTDTETDKDKGAPVQARAALDSSFDVFWTCCPRKEGKGAARRAFASAVNKTSPETIIAAMRAFAAKQVGNDPKFIPHPATWLNAERWLDAGLNVAAVDGTGPDHKVFVLAGSPQFEAWQKHLGRKIPAVESRAHGNKLGWHFDAEWPPPLVPELSKTVAAK